MNPATLPLRDIHLPPAPGWWPPAPGWWALVVIGIAAIAGLWWWRTRHRRLSAGTAARREIERLRRAAHEMGPALLAQELSVLLRRAAVSFYPRTDAAAITGENWLRFLDQPLTGQPFSTGQGRLIAELPYRRVVTATEAGPLLDLCAQWVEAAARGAGRKR